MGLWQPVETHAELEALLEALLACAWVLPAQEVEDFVTRRLFNKARLPCTSIQPCLALGVRPAVSRFQGCWP